MRATKNCKKNDSLLPEEYFTVKTFGFISIACLQYRRLHSSLAKPFYLYRYTRVFLPWPVAILGRDVETSSVGRQQSTQGTHIARIRIAPLLLSLDSLAANEEPDTKKSQRYPSWFANIVAWWIEAGMLVVPRQPAIVGATSPRIDLCFRVCGLVGPCLYMAEQPKQLGHHECDAAIWWDQSAHAEISVWL